MHKRRSEKQEITSEDFDSLFLWKVFWKLMRNESPAVFFLKILACAACFFALLFFIFLIDDLLGA